MIMQLERIPMSQQVEYFAVVKETLARKFGLNSTEWLLHKSLYLVVLGSNDYINNYMLPGASSRLMYSYQNFGDLLVSTYCEHIKVTYFICTHLDVVVSIIVIEPNYLTLGMVSREWGFTFFFLKLLMIKHAQPMQINIEPHKLSYLSSKEDVVEFYLIACEKYSYWPRRVQELAWNSQGSDAQHFGKCDASRV